MFCNLLIVRSLFYIEPESFVENEDLIVCFNFYFKRYVMYYFWMLLLFF